MSGDTFHLTSTSLRGIAHPLRVKILGLLRRDGPATATRLAERLGQSSGATSYHLRQLAAYGFVEEDTERGAGRERWWRAAHRSTMVEAEAIRAAPEEGEAYMRAIAASYAEQVDRWIGEALSLPDEWENSSTLSDYLLRLTPQEAQELHDGIFELIRRYRRYDAPEPAPEGSEQVAIQFQIMPFLADRGAA